MKSLCLHSLTRVNANPQNRVIYESKLNTEALSIRRGRVRRTNRAAQSEGLLRFRLAINPGHLGSTSCEEAMSAVKVTSHYCGLSE